MSNVVALSRDGNLADLEVVLEAEDTQRQYPLAQQALASADLQADLADSEVASAEALMADEVGVDSEEASKIAEAMAVVAVAVAAAEEELATKEVEASHPEAATEEIVAAPTDTHHLQVLPPDQAAHAEAATVEAEEVMAPAPLIAMEAPRQLVGMTRVVAVAHMMIDPADTVEVVVETTVIAAPLVVEVEATWSR